MSNPSLSHLSSVKSLYVSAASSTPRLVVEDTEQRKRIIASIHNASHLGLNRTNDMVASQCGNKKLKKAVGGLHPIPVNSD